MEKISDANYTKSDVRAIMGVFYCCPINIWHFSSVLTAMKSRRCITVPASVSAVRQAHRILASGSSNYRHQECNDTAKMVLTPTK